MTKYLISFPERAMDHIPEDELPAVAKAANDACEEAAAAGVFVYGDGLLPQRPTIVDADGMVTDGPFPETKEFIGGFAIVDVESREEAHKWAGKIAAACRCPQEVREFMEPPEFD